MPPRRKVQSPAVATGEDAKVSDVDRIIASMGSDATTLSDDGLTIHLPGVISSGSEWLDWGLGRGGWPLSRMCLVGGEEGAGKTTLALIACANAQKMGGIASYIDAEHKLDRGYAQAIGVDLGRLIMPKVRPEPYTVEENIEFASSLAKRYRESGSRAPFVIVYDSITGAMTEQEANGVDAPGMQGRAFSSGLRKLNPIVSSSALCLMLLSQLRERIGITFGSKYITTGGKAPRFYSAVIAHLEVKQSIKEGAKRTSDGKESGGRRVGHVLKVDVVKNQIAPPFRHCDVGIRYGVGIDYLESVAGLLKELDMIEISGAWTRYIGPGAAEPGADGEIRWSGIGALRKIQNEDPGTFAQLVAAVRSAYPCMRGE